MRHASSARLGIATTALWFVAVFPQPAPAQGEADGPTVESATLLMRSTMAVHRNGQHHRLLRALRHMRDPALKPIFTRLANSTHPALQVHGILGLAECEPNGKIDLLRLASIRDGSVQAQVVTAAIDAGLLDHEQSRELLTWVDLDPAVKMLVSMQLIRDKQPVDVEMLLKAAQSDNLARFGLASALLVAMGDERGQQNLNALNLSKDPQRDAVRAMLLNTALRYEFDRLATWAWSVSTEAQTPRKLNLLALRTAMRFGAVGADQMWTQQYRTTNDPVERTRLALTAMELSPWLKPQLFDPLKASEDDLIRKIGDAGAAVAGHREVAERVTELVGQHHTLANRWSLEYARDHASDDDAVKILWALVVAFEAEGSPRTLSRRLDAAVSATRVLVERNETRAVELLGPKLASSRTDGALKQGILLGLIQADGESPHRVVADVMPLNNANANRMAVYLLARHGDQPLTQPQLDDLAVMVRGGGRMPDALRLQAAWTYLKLTKQSDRVVTAMLDR